MEKKNNRCISCSVYQCANNSGEGYCALDKINVVSHEANPTVSECTDCESFVLDSKDDGKHGCSGCN